MMYLANIFQIIEPITLLIIFLVILFHYIFINYDKIKKWLISLVKRYVVLPIGYQSLAKDGDGNIGIILTKKNFVVDNKGVVLLNENISENIKSKINLLNNFQKIEEHYDKVLFLSENSDTPLLLHLNELKPVTYKETLKYFSGIILDALNDYEKVTELSEKHKNTKSIFSTFVEVTENNIGDIKEISKLNNDNEKIEVGGYYSVQLIDFKTIVERKFKKHFYIPILNYHPFSDIFQHNNYNFRYDINIFENVNIEGDYMVEIHDKSNDLTLKF